MGLFKKKADPIASRARALNDEISALESEIKRLSGSLHHTHAQPNVRSTTTPHGPQVAPPHLMARTDPIFERVDRGAPAAASDGHYNDLGVRKYDLLNACQKFRALFRGSEAANPKLVEQLARGSIRGLRPLRYEKRIARNRFIVLTLFFLLVLWGILAVIFNHR